MVVVVGRGNVQHRVKREGNYPGGDVQGEMSGLQNSQPIVNLSHGMLFMPYGITARRRAEVSLYSPGM